MSLGLINKIKKKSLEFDIDSKVCPIAYPVVRSLTISSGRKSPTGSCSSSEWKHKEQSTTITTAYHFDSGLTHFNPASPSLPQVQAVPLPRKRSSSSDCLLKSSSVVTPSHSELKRNKSLMSGIPGKNILNPIFKRKSSSSSLNDSASTSFSTTQTSSSSYSSSKMSHSSTNASSVTGRTLISSTPILEIPPYIKSSTESICSDSSFTERDPNFTIVVDDKFDL